MKGVIEKISPRFAKNGNQFWLVTIDGENYSIWDSKIMEGLALNGGDYVDFSFTESKGYKNIDAICKVEPQSAGQREGAEPNIAQNQQRIMRMSVLKSAAEIVARSYLEEEKKAVGTIEIRVATKSM